MKTTLPLDVFTKFVLPNLRQQYQGDALQQHVSSTFDITENGQPIDVRFTGHTNHGDITASITKAIDAIARTPMQHKAIRNIDGGGMVGMGGFKTHGETTQHFKGEGAKEKALAWGAWALAAFGGSEKAMAFCEANAIEVKTGQNEGTNTAGGYLVPDVLSDYIIDLRLRYGVARRNSRIETMTSDTKRVSRRAGGLTSSFVGEAQPGSVSTKNWDQIQLVAKKQMAIGLISSEVMEDVSIVNLGDDLAGECAYAFSRLEDQCAFVGDGTSTYGSMFGLTNKLVTINGVDDGGGIVLASGNLFSEFVLADFHNTLARCPSFAREGAKWYASPLFIDSVMNKQVYAAGGNTTTDLTQGTRPSFLGYPVERVEVMPVADANSQIACLFGNMAQASTFGDRRVVTIDLSKSGVVNGVDVFLTDQILVRGTERFDFIAHDLGTATAAGPMVGLMSAAA